ncbi:MAG: 1-acyl-sn-glycerol-3-phosphate acyltransferase [Tannerella sp.]|jgi:1-acyl-sn-glycerol-3-phosphate acyltransferase|nr:1-acyl-sn-glycerol-3-phosphate acyltransferase [Tannerella sp.]
MLQILYILYFWLIVMPVFCIATILTASLVIVGCLLGGERFFSYYPGMVWSRFTCYLALCPVKVKGRELLDGKQSCVFVANHQSAFDIFLIYGFLGVPIKWMLRQGIAKIPFVGAACRSAGFIFVDHSSPQAVRRSIAEAKVRLRDGASLAIFPEGSRTRNGKMGRFRKGAFHVALSQRLPVVPITINGTYHVLPKGTLNVRPHRMEMVIHAPVQIDEHVPDGKDGLQTFADDVQKIIAASLWKEFV